MFIANTSGISEPAQALCLIVHGGSTCASCCIEDAMQGLLPPTTESWPRALERNIPPHHSTHASASQYKEGTDLRPGTLPPARSASSPYVVLFSIVRAFLHYVHRVDSSYMVCMRLEKPMSDKQLFPPPPLNASPCLKFQMSM